MVTRDYVIITGTPRSRNSTSLAVVLVGKLYNFGQGWASCFPLFPVYFLSFANITLAAVLYLLYTHDSEQAYFPTSIGFTGLNQFNKMERLGMKRTNLS